MLCLKALEPQHLDLVSIQRPARALGVGEVRVQIKATGICASDVHVYHGQNPMANYPVILGHEAAGIVLELGADVANCQVGSHVVLEPLLACTKCYACKKNRPNACSSMKARGCHIDGFFCEEVVVDSKSVFPISSKVSWQAASMVEPYTIAAQVAYRARAAEGDLVLILGAGTVGITVLDVLSFLGCPCISVDIDPERLQVAQRHGAVSTVLSTPSSWTEELEQCLHDYFQGESPNIVVEATGMPSFLSLAMNFVSSAGRIVNLGFSPKAATIVPLDLSKKEIDILGSRHQTFQFLKVIDWVETGLLQADKIISQEYNFKDSLAAFQAIDQAAKERRNLGKLLLHWN